MIRPRRFASLSGRRGLAAAAMAAVLVLAVRVVQQLLSALLYVDVLVAQGSLPGFFSASLWGFVLGVLPFVVGVFLSLWLLAPVAAELPVAQVITRSLLAALAGVIVVYLGTILGQLFSRFDESAGYVYGWATGLFSTVAGIGSWLGSYALVGALSTGITLVPLTVVAGVLLWVWLRSHPAKQPVADPEGAEV